MNHDSNDATKHRIVYRRDMGTLLQRSYVLSSEEYERLVSLGLDPERMDEEELMQCATHCRSHDDLGRIVTEASKIISKEVRVYSESEL